MCELKTGSWEKRLLLLQTVENLNSGFDRKASECSFCSQGSGQQDKSDLPQKERVLTVMQMLLWHAPPKTLLWTINSCSKSRCFLIAVPSISRPISFQSQAAHVAELSLFTITSFIQKETRHDKREENSPASKQCILQTEVVRSGDGTACPAACQLRPLSGQEYKAPQTSQTPSTFMLTKADLY